MFWVESFALLTTQKTMGFFQYKRGRHLGFQHCMSIGGGGGSFFLLRLDCLVTETYEETHDL